MTVSLLGELVVQWPDLAMPLVHAAIGKLLHLSIAVCDLNDL